MKVKTKISIMFLSVLFVFAFVFGISNQNKKVNAATITLTPTTGINFTWYYNENGSALPNNYYKLRYSTNVEINTVEAWINMPNTVTDDTNGGTILGNYPDDTNTIACTNFQIGEYGKPKIHIGYNGGYYAATFDYDVRGKGNIHIAFTINRNAKTAYCYINGSKVSEKSLMATSSNTAGNNPLIRKNSKEPSSKAASRSKRSRLASTFFAFLLLFLCLLCFCGGM